MRRLKICATGLFLSVSFFMFASGDAVFLQGTPIFVGKDSFTSRVSSISDTREPFALVLSGGSARAYAHIGVLRQLEKAGIIPDFIVANSMGAVIGLLYAAGFSPDDIEFLVTNVQLSEYFDLIVPTKGGLISTRYFQERLGNLFPNQEFDIANSAIPIIITAEDLYSKRTVWFAEGCIQAIMAAAFAMPFMMEPIPYTLADNTKLFLIDSGTVDLGGIQVAKQFTNNIIVSTALYEPVLNYNNPIVNLNRIFSIGKERILITDILEIQPYVIRNNVEYFSFMDFSKAQEIIYKGDDAAKEFLQEHKESLFPFTKEINNEDFVHLRKKRASAVQDFVYRDIRGEKPKSLNPYFGFKLRPNIAAIDGPQLVLQESFSVGSYAFFDYRSFFIRAGVKSDLFTQYGADFFARICPIPQLTIQTTASFLKPFDPPAQQVFYSGSLIFLRIPITSSLFISPYITSELISNCSLIQASYVTQTGLGLKKTEDTYLAFSIDSFYFMHMLESLGIYHGLGFDSYIDLRLCPFLGIKFGELIRWTPKQQAAIVFPSDVFRGKIPLHFRGSQPQAMLSISKAEIYWYTSHTTITALEAFKVEKIKIGVYADVLWHGQNILDIKNDIKSTKNNNTNTAIGGFLRSQISLSGLYLFNLDASIGWNIQSKTVNMQLRFARNW